MIHRKYFLAVVAHLWKVHPQNLPIIHMHLRQIANHYFFKLSSVSEAPPLIFG